MITDIITLTNIVSQTTDGKILVEDIVKLGSRIDDTNSAQEGRM